MVNEKCSNVSIISCLKNSIRSNHYHLDDWHYIYVLKGRINYFFTNLKRTKVYYKIINTNDIIFTPPMEIHATHFPVNTELLVVSKNKRNKTMARVFQSFRIAVNNEIGNLKKFLKKYISYVKVGGKIVIISFHSIEDRIVKHSFKSSSNKGVLKILTKKPIMASEEEKNFNKRSKSAKLRCAIKL